MNPPRHTQIPNMHTSSYTLRYLAKERAISKEISASFHCCPPPSNTSSSSRHTNLLSSLSPPRHHPLPLPPPPPPSSTSRQHHAGIWHVYVRPQTKQRRHRDLHAQQPARLSCPRGLLAHGLTLGISLLARYPHIHATLPHRERPPHVMDELIPAARGACRSGLRQDLAHCWSASTSGSIPRRRPAPIEASASWPSSKIVPPSRSSIFRTLLSIAKRRPRVVAR